MSYQRKYYTRLPEEKQEWDESDYRDENYYRDATYYHDHEKSQRRNSGGQGCFMDNTCGGENRPKDRNRSSRNVSEKRALYENNSRHNIRQTTSNSPKVLHGKPNEIWTKDGKRYNSSISSSRKTSSSVGLHSPPKLSHSGGRCYGNLLPQLERRECVSEERDCENLSGYPLQVRQPRKQLSLYALEEICNKNLLMAHYQVIGHPSLNIHRFRLPREFHPYLRYLVAQCERRAKSKPNGWHTELYSLTKQDMALRDVSNKCYKIGRMIANYIKRMVCLVYNMRDMKMDSNQPHVLKYSGEHKGVGLHHDKSDVTINIMLSQIGDYSGGGTYFPGANSLVRLEFGEYLLHPGNAVHSGRPILSGTRYLMVIFGDRD